MTIPSGLAIQEITVNADQKVVSMDWTYANTDGHLKGVHRMLEPYGDVPLGNVTSEVALAWLQEQLSNTTEEFDEYLAEQKSTEEARRASSEYKTNPIEAPTRIGPAFELVEQ